jgi:hypothetical protein
MTSFYFLFIDSCGNPLTGSKCILRSYAPPYTSGSYLSLGFPITQYTDQTGYVEFDDVISGVYKVTVGNSINSPNYANTIFYIQLPDTGSLVNGQDFII